MHWELQERRDEKIRVITWGDCAHHFTKLGCNRFHKFHTHFLECKYTNGKYMNFTIPKVGEMALHHSSQYHLFLLYCPIIKLWWEIRLKFDSKSIGSIGTRGRFISVRLSSIAYCKISVGSSVWSISYQICKSVLNESPFSWKRKLNFHTWGSCLRKMYWSVFKEFLSVSVLW
mgnify:CR=1 FL=1